MYDPAKIKADFLVGYFGQVPLFTVASDIVKNAKKECGIDFTDYVNVLFAENETLEWIAKDMAFQVNRVKSGL
jgi:hypothetical protein